MKNLIKSASLLCFCFVLTFNVCNAMSVHVKTFYEAARGGRLVEFDVCRKAVIDTLSSISELVDKRDSLDTLGQVVNIGADEDCPLTVEEEIEGMIAGNVRILQNVGAVLDRQEATSDTTALKAQLAEIFEGYSGCDPKMFPKKCKELLESFGQ